MGVATNKILLFTSSYRHSLGRRGLIVLLTVPMLVYDSCLVVCVLVFLCFFLWVLRVCLRSVFMALLDIFTGFWIRFFNFTPFMSNIALELRIIYNKGYCSK